jgi:hypothetical protein
MAGAFIPIYWDESLSTEEIAPAIAYKSSSRLDPFTTPFCNLLLRDSSWSLYKRFPLGQRVRAVH